jgi:hypothetical protein
MCKYTTYLICIALVTLTTLGLVSRHAIPKSTTKTTNKLCHICGQAGNSAMKYPNTLIGLSGKTCSEVLFETVKITDVSKCKTQQQKWSMCCNGKPPGSSTKPPKQEDIPNVVWTGPNKRCDVCRGGSYPSKVSMVLNFLYMGLGSCKQYYIKGREGKIPDHLCSVVQYYAWDPCGCGVKS